MSITCESANYSKKLAFHAAKIKRRVRFPYALPNRVEGRLRLEAELIVDCSRQAVQSGEQEPDS